MTLDQSIITTYAPLVSLFPYADPDFQPAGLPTSPTYDPDSVDAFLDTVFVGSSRDPVGGPARDFDVGGGPQLTTADSYLYIPDDPGADAPIRTGTTSAPVYVHLVPVPGAENLIDLQYWLFYPVRGRSTMFLAEGDSRFDVDFVGPMNSSGQYVDGYQGVGEHLGDWKHITARVDAATGDLEAVFYSQHGAGVWVTAADGFRYDGMPVLRSGASSFQPGDRILAYSSRNTHSCLPVPGQYGQYNASRTEFGMSAGLQEWAAAGPEWDTSTGWVVVANTTDVPAPATTPSWLNFAGRWGPSGTQYIDPSTWDPFKEVFPSVVVDLWRPFLTLISKSSENASSPPLQTGWGGDPAGPLGSRILAAFWGGSPSLGDNGGDGVIDVTALAQNRYSGSTRTFLPDGTVWGAVSAATPVLMMTWLHGDDPRVRAAYAVAASDSITLA